MLKVMIITDGNRTVPALRMVTRTGIQVTLLAVK